MERDAAEVILREYAPGLSADRAASLLDRKAVTRTVAGIQKTFFDPYASALAFILQPDTLTEKQQGDVREKTIDPKMVVDYLTAESAALRATFPADDARAGTETPITPDLVFMGWSNRGA